MKYENGKNWQYKDFIFGSSHFVASKNEIMKKIWSEKNWKLCYVERRMKYLYKVILT